MLERLKLKLTKTESRDAAVKLFFEVLAEEFPEVQRTAKPVRDLVGEKTLFFSDTAPLRAEGYSLPRSTAVANHRVCVGGVSAATREVVEAATQLLEEVLVRLDPNRYPQQVLGIPDRHEFTEVLGEFVDDHAFFGLILLQLNPIKPAGKSSETQLLKAITLGLQAEASAGDRIFFFGHRVFALLVARPDVETTVGCALRKRSAAARLVKAAGLPYLVAAGVACWPKHHTMRRSLIGSAEAALTYRANDDLLPPPIPPPRDGDDEGGLRRKGGPPRGGPEGPGVLSPRTPRGPLWGGAAKRLGEED